MIGREKASAVWRGKKRSNNNSSRRIVIGQGKYKRVRVRVMGERARENKSNGRESNAVYNFMYLSLISL